MPNENITSGEAPEKNAPSAAKSISSTPNQVTKTKTGKMVRQKPYMIAIVVLAILALGGISFGVAGLVANDQIRAEVDDLRTELDEEASVEVVEDIAETGEKVIVERRGITAKDLLIRGDKLINKGDSPLSFSLWDSQGSLSVSLDVREAGTLSSAACDQGTNEKLAQSTYEASIALDWGEVKGWFNIENSKTGYETFTISNIDASRVVDVMVGGYGQAPHTTTVFFLMDDGTVEYIPVGAALRTGDVRSYGKLAGVEGVIRLLGTQVNDGCFGGVDTLAQKANGDFYRLSTILEATGNYKF